MESSPPIFEGYPKGDQIMVEQLITSHKTLPNEIWVKVFSHLCQKEAVKGRTVCQQWRNVIDEHCEYSIVINEDTTDLDQLSHLKIKDLLISKLSSDINLIYFPETLKRIRFWGDIHPTTFQRILSGASSLEKLSLTKAAITQRNLLTCRLDLLKLTKIEVHGHNCIEEGTVVVANLDQLLSQDFPALENILINVALLRGDLNFVVAAFIGFLSRHKKTLLHVNAILTPDLGDGKSIAPLPTKIPQSMMNSLIDGQLQLKTLRLGLANRYISIWLPIIQSLRKLETLKIQWIIAFGVPLHPSAFGIKVDRLHETLARSAATLTHVELRDVSIRIDGNGNPIPFDARVLANAKNLRKLILTCRQNDESTELRNSPLTIINLSQSFPNLVDLEIMRFCCVSSDLEVLFGESNEIENVKLQLTDSQGLHWGIVESLFKKCKIKILNLSPIEWEEENRDVKRKGLEKEYSGLYPGLSLEYRGSVYIDFDRLRQNPSRSNFPRHWEL